MYGLVLVTPPAQEPVSPAELRDWLRLAHGDDDASLVALARAARGVCERYLGRQLVTATWRLTLDGFGGGAPIRLPRAPLQSVSLVEYYDDGNVLRTLPTSVYVVDTASDPGTLSLAQDQVWPVTRLRPDAVRITFVAGYGAALQVPEEIKLAIKMTAALFYEHPGDDGHPEELPAAAKRLLALSSHGVLEYG